MLARQTLIKLGRHLAQHTDRLSSTSLELSQEFTRRRKLDTGLGEFKSDRQIFEAYKTLFYERESEEINNGTQV